MTKTAATLANGVIVSVDNIVRVFRAASHDDHVNGMRWYEDAHNLATAMADGDLVKGAAILAALSPRTPWGTNVLLAERCITDGEIVSGTLKANMRNANRIMSGESADDILTGPKVRAFFSTIVDPTDAESVVIDTHAISVAAGRTLSQTERKVLERVGVYEILSGLYREAAEILGCLPHHVQSVTWLAWRHLPKADKRG